ncbi:nucleotide-binding domain-containing protein [Venturia nashicola]|uniref:NADPH:adrenodoxin oxidoreductase, mitochondrial n=1 Tax=Venturia nashicola TaxID=86259 RepID=A0A4Z1PKU7_9PEZI|nr:nucleotide-binding domain-containing protein [Venturia nashicola]
MMPIAFRAPKKPSTFGRIRRHVSTTQRPFRLAVIGSGPAAFYASSKVLQKHPDTFIDMYERLPIPFGLVRYGVAPDHPEVKNCQERFEEVAALPNFNFIGNINVGVDVSLKDMKPHYDAFLFAYGASKDRELGIQGEDLEGVMSARAFVGWYNGLPEYSHLKPILERGDDAVVIGQGNVALDVARILLSDVDRLRKTDMPEYALELLSRSKISKVHAVGRRGPMQAAFTIKEVRELINLSNVNFSPIPNELFPADLKALPRPRKRLAELLLKDHPINSTASKSFTLDFLLSPTTFNASSPTSQKLQSVEFHQNIYTDPSDLSNPSASIHPSSPPQNLTLPATAAFRSIGYKAEPLPGMSDISVPFDSKRGFITNYLGRITSTSNSASPISMPGLYVAGWAKRGPTGVIASTMEDAFSTADSLIHDIETGSPMLNTEEGSTGLGWEGLRKETEGRGVQTTSWRDWLWIDHLEKEEGKKLGKEREKMTSVEEMLGCLE